MNLICSKSRILPKKKAKEKAITTPRAELLAALLLAKLIVKFLDATELEVGATPESCWHGSGSHRTC